MIPRPRNKGLLVLSSAVILLCATLSYSIPRTESGPGYYVETVAGSGRKGLADGSAETASFNWPTGVAVAPAGTVAAGTVYIADYSNNSIRTLSPDGLVETVAGSGRPGYADGPGSAALLRGPDNIAIDRDGNVYVADADNYMIRKLSPDGIVTTVAGNGQSGYRDGKAADAMFGYPTGIGVDARGNLYVADRRTHTVRKITPAGFVLTLAGNGQKGYADGHGIASHLREPISLAVTDDGTVFVADSGNNAVRKITPDGTITTLAGGRRGGYRDGAGSEAMFHWPTGIALGPLGNIYLCDSNNNRIRRITANGVVTTIAGASLPGLSDEEGFRARFKFPTGITVDSGGNIYVADSGNNTIRRITRGPTVSARAGTSAQKSR